MARTTYTERRFSICVGINSYASGMGLSDLRFAEADAQAMDALFGELGVALTDRHLLLGKNATLGAITATLDEVILDLADEKDLVLLFFAGHGVPVMIGEADNAEPEVYLAPFDFDPQQARRRSFQRRGLSMTRLREDYFSGKGARKRLFIFDSCYSGEFAGPGYRSDVDPVAGRIQQLLEGTPTGRVALASCLPTQKAVEDSALGHGLLTYHILRALHGWEPLAKHPDGAISVGSLFHYLSKALSPQCPVLSGTQHESFVLITSDPPITALEPTLLIPEANRKASLTALFHDHTGFLQSRLDSFVGRTVELAAIRSQIARLQPEGGYVRAFLKAALFRMLSKHCQEGNGRLIAFIRDLVNGY